MRTFVPPTSFVSSPETEKERLLYMTASVASGFYPRHGFLIFPHIEHGFEENIVIIPEVVRNFNPKYWVDAKKAGSSMPLKLSKFMWNEAKHTNLEPVDLKSIKAILSKWKSIEDSFWKFIKINFSKEINWIGEIEIRVTKIGSLGSHYLLTKKRKQKLIIHIREDSDYENIANLIILALIYPTSKDLDLSFSQRMVIRDFITSKNEFIKMFPKWKQKKYNSIKLPKKLRDSSLEYIKYLKIPNIIDPIEVINKNLIIFGIKEAKLLSLFIKNKNELLTYDQIADCIWGEGKFKSYWAINKLIQRIVKKLDRLDVENVRILGLHGKGYKLQV